MHRPWAFWRRTIFVSGILIFLLIAAIGGYFFWVYESATCFDGIQNGAERGRDCGGGCERVCAFEVIAPTVKWAKAFPIDGGMYNAVAYVENKNKGIGAIEVGYTFSFYDSSNRVTSEKSGITVLPPDSVYPIFEGRIMLGAQPPSRTELVLHPTDSWSNMPIGREQFVVESRVLKGADNSPRLEATLRNTSLTDAFNVEAVATIFDSRGNPLTASRTHIPLFEGREAKQIVFTWPLPIAKTVRSCEVPSDVILAIDVSGSMDDDGGTPPEPLATSLQAARDFVLRLRTGDKAGLVTYASRGNTNALLTGDHEAVAAQISALSIDPPEQSGSTNIFDGITHAHSELSTMRHSADARKVLVLLTDGRANAPINVEAAETKAREAAESAKRSNVDIYTIGLGSSVNRQFLTDVASSERNAHFAASRATLDQIYRTISTAICEEGAAVIDIIPKVESTF